MTLQGTRKLPLYALLGCLLGRNIKNRIRLQKDPICFMLINQEIANSYRKYFEILWKISRKGE